MGESHEKKLWQVEGLRGVGAMADGIDTFFFFFFWNFLQFQLILSLNKEGKYHLKYGGRHFDYSIPTCSSPHHQIIMFVPRL